MNIKEVAGWLGQWELIISDKQGNIIERTGLKPNLIMDVALNMMRDALNGTVTDLKIKYVALGNSAAALANTQATLTAEQFRKAVTSQTALAGVGELETILFVTDTEANTFKTEEIGWFAGAAASATVNTGIMVARILYSRQKTSLEEWTLRRVDTVGRG